MLARLQLALGKAAIIRGELPADGPRLRFAGHGPDDDPSLPPTRIIVLHPPPPDGSAPGVLLDRMASIRTINNNSLAAPMATGEFGEMAWIVEPAPRTSTIADRIGAGEKLGMEEVVRLLRESARALAGMHRRNLTHGALSPAAVCATAEDVMLHRLGTGNDGTVDGDLTALGNLALQALVGPFEVDASPRLRQLRPIVPEALEVLIQGLINKDSPAHPKSAAEVLSALDVFPTAEYSTLDSLMDSAGRGGRDSGRNGNLLTILGGGAVVLVIWLLTRLF